MANPNGREGAQFETDVMRWLRGAGALCERLVKAGKNDEGDLVAIIAGKQYILELKNRKTISLPEFWREAEVEAEAVLSNQNYRRCLLRCILEPPQPCQGLQL